MRPIFHLTLRRRMIIKINKDLFDSYNDNLKVMFETYKVESQSHIWHLDSKAKRFIYDMVYSDYLRPLETTFKEPQSILDIGGGYTGLTPIIYKNHNYTLIDFNKPEDENVRWYKDWFLYYPNYKYDCIIANDIFPNVDQRLEEFLTRFLPTCKELRLVLTTYDNRWYTTQRIDSGDEILTIKAWDDWQLNRVLNKFSYKITSLDSPTHFGESIFPNGRHVYYVIMKGTAC